MKIRSFLTITLVLAAIALSTPAFATTCRSSIGGTGTLFTLSAGGLTALGYTTDAATACVKFGSSTVTIDLNNNTASITNVPELLVGFSFTGPSSFGTIGALGGSAVSAAGFIDCVDGSCLSDGSFDAEKGSGTDAMFDSPYLWGTASGTPTSIGTTGNAFSPGTMNVGFFAGNSTGGQGDNSGSGSSFSLHPSAILNSSDSVSGPAHNDVLFGRVTFTFSCTLCTSSTTR